MDKLTISQHKASFDSIARYVENDQNEQVEVWYARELQAVLGYARWENFQLALNRAIVSCEMQKIRVRDHFREVTKMIAVGKGGTREVEDFLPTLTIAAKNLATEMTNYNVSEKDLQGESSITTEHVQNNRSVRTMLGKRNIRPEDLPSAEDIKKLERRTNTTEKGIAGGAKKLPD